MAGGGGASAVAGHKGRPPRPGRGASGAVFDFRVPVLRKPFRPWPMHGLLGGSTTLEMNALRGWGAWPFSLSSASRTRRLTGAKPCRQTVVR